MKKLLLLLSVMLLTFAANSQALKTRSDGTFTQADTYIVGLNTLGVPFGTTPGLNGGLARNGQLYYNTANKTLYVYDLATTSWKVVTPATDLSSYYTKSETNTLLASKADLATTIAGYGITDFNSLGDARWAKLTGGNNLIGNQSISSGGSDGLYFGYGSIGSGYGGIWAKSIFSKTVGNANLLAYDGLTELQANGAGAMVDINISGSQKFAVDATDTYLINRVNMFNVGAGSIANTILTRNGNVIEEIPGSSYAIASGNSYNYLKRSYDATVTVTTTITAAVAGISDASATKRYMVYVPAGTYNGEAIIAKDYVDIIGEDINTVFVNSSSTANDTFNGHAEMLLSGITFTHTSNIGDTHRYPIHIDNSGSGIAHTMVVYKVKAQTLGTYVPPGGGLVYGAIGIGLHQGQRLDLIDVSGISTTMPGILAHNVNAQSYAVQLNLINTTGTSTAYEGFRWSNEGSGKTDQVNIVGGAYTGTIGIYTINDGPGTNETKISIDHNTSASSINVLTGSRVYGNENLYKPLNATQQNQNFLAGGDDYWDIGKPTFNRFRNVYITGDYNTLGTYTTNGGYYRYNNSVGDFKGWTHVDAATGDLVTVVGASTGDERTRIQSADGTLLVGLSSKPFSGVKFAVGGDVSVGQLNSTAIVMRDNLYNVLAQQYIVSGVMHWGYGTGVSDKQLWLADGTVLMGYTSDPGGTGVNKFAVNGNAYATKWTTAGGTALQFVDGLGDLQTIPITPKIVAKADLSAQTTVGNITTYAVPTTGDFAISIYINLTAVAGGNTLNSQCVYTDQTSTVRTITVNATLSTAGSIANSQATFIRALGGTTITLKTNNPVATGSNTFDAGAMIQGY